MSDRDPEVFGEYDPDDPCPRCFMPAYDPYEDEAIVTNERSLWPSISSILVADIEMPGRVCGSPGVASPIERTSE